MKHKFAIPALLTVLLLLPGCQLAEKLKDFGAVAVTAITTPVGSVDIYRVKNVYAASLELFDEYRRYCWLKPYAVLMTDPVARPLCGSRRATVRLMQDAKSRASTAIMKAEAAPNLLSAAWDAVQAFRSTIPSVK